MEALRRVRPALRPGAQGRADTAEGFAHAVIDFALQMLTEDHEDVADVLRQLEAVGVGQALDAHPAPAGSLPVRLTHRVRAHRDIGGAVRIGARVTVARCTAPTIVVHSIGIAAPHQARAAAGRAPLSHTPLTAT
ncbi:hypothetical protein AB0B95_33635 [Streptomyces hygroscopicus]|uniref:hypothetical protein n=2 Tax=Streptomyces hygroscopicus TaxID=1912 RepID=UPI000A57B5DC|nr:hypothetical protein [Streptomyces hygroscopicus]